jgi:hypothetical protein
MVLRYLRLTTDGDRRERTCRFIDLTPKGRMETSPLS